jgi:hypothetical protein
VLDVMEVAACHPLQALRISTLPRLVSVSVFAILFELAPAVCRAKIEEDHDHAHAQEEGGAQGAQ